MPRVDKKHKEERKKQILMAAFMCFNRNGYQQTTMRHISKEAKLSIGAIYSYFPSKEQMVRELALYGEIKNKEMFGRNSKDENPLEQLMSVIMHYLRMFDKKETISGMRVDLNLQSAALHDSEIHAVVKNSVQKRVQSIRDLLKEAKNAGLIDPNVNIDQSAQIILSILTGATLQKLFNPGIDLETYSREVEKWLLKLSVK